ncbi:MAG: phasin family protein [Rhodobiaceae bacterium]|nr:phasin family protein [Rhodobiaceae bacterium]
MANDKTPFEIPSEFRDFADTSIDHARKAFDGYLQQTRKAVADLDVKAGKMKSESSGTQDRIFGYAEENVAAALDYARQLINAASPADFAEIQRSFLENQMNTLSRQSTELAEIAKSALSAMAEPPKK